MHENHVIVKRMGARALPLPIHLTVEYIDGTSLTISKSMDIWENGENQINIDIENVDKVKSISLDTESVPDIDHSNNYIEIH